MSKAYCWYRPHPCFSNFYPGKILDLITDTKIFYEYLTDTAQIKLAQNFFPDGLSPHGLSKLSSCSTNDETLTESITEIIFELARQSRFPNSPSRFTSLYASKSIEQAKKWQQFWCDTFGDEISETAQSLWEISYETNAMLYDANFLNIMANDEFSYITALDSAYRYWQGDFSEEPLPELLIPYPVTITRIIRNFDTL